MKVYVNEMAVEVPEGTSILAFLVQKELKPGTVIVEHNLEIVAREAWESVILAPEDQLQIVSFVGGG